jgi:hypothetical protein
MKTRIALTLLALMSVLVPSFAALEFTLTPSTQIGPVGSEVTFTGTLRNTSATDLLFLNDIQPSFNSASSAALTPYPNVFFSSAPGILLPNEIYSGPIFGFAIKSSPIQANYSGSITIRGGTGIFALTDLLTQSFQVSADLPIAAITANHLQLQFRRSSSATDISYVIEGCSDLAANTWSPVLTRSQNGVWTVNQPGASVAESASGNFVSVTATDAVPVIDPNTSQATPHRFLRLRITH